MIVVARVLRAIYEAERQPMSDDDWAAVVAWHTSPEVVRKGGEWSHLRMARAAVEVMREPTGRGQAMTEKIPERVERVARALYAARHARMGRPLDNFDDWPPEYRAGYYADARAAIEAMDEAKR
jgi:hypothetical protein